MVRVRFFSALKTLTNGDQETKVENAKTVGEVLDSLTLKYGKRLAKGIFDPKTGQVKRYIIVSVNGKDIRHLKGLETSIEDSDEVAILPAAAGG